jgi:hypothetical protein
MSQGNQKMYLYDNIIDIVLDSYGVYVDNRPMNNRKLIAHKGMTNELLFNITDRDRKKQNVFGKSFSANLVNPTSKRRVLSKLLEETTKVGQIKLSLNDGDLVNIDAGLYTIYIVMQKEDGSDAPVFTDQNNGLKFQIEISDQIGREPVKTQTIETFLQSGEDIYTSSAVKGNVDRNFNHSLHSLAIYPSGYSGTITIQGSCLENSPNSDEASLDWFDISDFSLTTSSVLTHKTFKVNANWIRIKHVPTAGSISKVLIRN